MNKNSFVRFSSLYVRTFEPSKLISYSVQTYDSWFFYIKGIELLSFVVMTFGSITKERRHNTFAYGS